jgi:hypothetical protein
LNLNHTQVGKYIKKNKGHGFLEKSRENMSNPYDSEVEVFFTWNIGVGKC